MIDNFQLRPYQIEALNTIYNDLQIMPEVLLSAVMGAGKTCMSVKLIERLARENPDMNFLILIHKRELITQFQKAFEKFTEIHWRNIGIVCAGLGSKVYNRKVTIASVQTFANQMQKHSGAGLIIIDECHSVNLDSDTMYRKVLDYLRLQRPNCRILGITATEYRLGLGEIYGTRNKPGSVILFPKLNYKIPYSVLRDAGYLVPLRGVIAAHESMEQDLAGITTNGDYNITEIGEVMSREYHLDTAVQAIKEHCHGMDCVCVVCVDINHAEKLYELLGEEATIVHSQLTEMDRKNNMLAWESGEKRIMVSVKILLEGYDLPRLKAIVFLRPTLSTGLYLQAIGRVLRTSPGKEFGLLVDVTDNATRLLKQFNLDHPVVTVPKTVEAAAERKESSMFKICPECESEVHKALRECLECGFVWPEEECVVAEALPAMKDVTFNSSALIPSEPEIFEVQNFEIEIHKSKKNGKLLGKVTYFFERSPFKMEKACMWLCFPDYYDGFAVEIAKKKWTQISDDDCPATVDEFMDASFLRPKHIVVDLNGQYPELKEVICEGEDVDVDFDSPVLSGEYEDDDIPF